MAAHRIPYPHWRIFELLPANMQQIRQLTDNATNEMFFEEFINIANTHIEPPPGQENRVGCERLYRPRPNAPAEIRARFRLESFYSHNLHPGNLLGDTIRNFVAIDIHLRIPVGFMQLLVKNDMGRGIFSLDTGENNNEINEVIQDLQAYCVYIDFSCSFTHSPYEYEPGQTIAAYYAGQLGAYILSLAKFMHRRIAELMLNEVNAENDENINYVLFYSHGIEEARPQHRKNGKLSACSFMEDWTNALGQSPQEVFNVDDEDLPAMMFYLYMPGGVEFIGSDLYDVLVARQYDLSRPRAGVPGDAGYYNDENYYCLRDELPNEEMGGGRRRKAAASSYRGFRKHRLSLRKKLTRRRRPRARTQRK